MNIKKYGQYKYDIFKKLDFNFLPNKKILDVGCGDGSDARIFIEEFKLDTSAIDIYEHPNISQIKQLKFNLADINNIPYENNCFDYVFLHDTLHHIDEPKQRMQVHLKSFNELERVCKVNGTIIIVEGNRYNPLFYPHMVKIRGHDHWSQKYFKRIILKGFGGSSIEFRFFEAHLYPKQFYRLFKLYEKLMEKFSPKRFLAYNVAVIKNEK